MEGLAQHIIGRGFAGWHALGLDRQGNRCSSSGGDLAGYLAQAVDGALVYDAEHLEADPETARAFIRHVISGPMCEPGFPPGHMRRLGEGCQPRPHDGSPLGPLDAIAPDLYAPILRAVPGGIRIGHVQSGAIVWDAPARKAA